MSVRCTVNRACWMDDVSVQVALGSRRMKRKGYSGGV